MPVLPTGRSGNTAGDVLDAARAALNDQAYDPVTGALLDPQVFTNTFLMPHLNAAYRRVQRDLRTRGFHHEKKTATYTLAVGGVAIDFDGVAPNLLLPDDYANLETLEERASGSSDRWVEIHEVDNGLSARSAGDSLQEYELGEDGKINFIGATSAREIRMRYQKELPKLGATSDIIYLIDAVDVLAYRTAYNAARARGATQAAAPFRLDYDEELSLLVAAYWRPEQKRPARRKPYGARRRAIR